MSTRILIAGNYGQSNLGDEAILAGALAGLRAIDPTLRLSVVTADPEGTARAHGVETVAIRDPGATRDAVTASDLVVVGGGGLLNDYWAVDIGRVLFDPGWGLTCHTLPALTAAALGKPYGFLAVGAGPLEDPHAREYVAALLSGAAFASVRDETSRRLLIDCGADPAHIDLAADPACLLEARHSPTVDAILEEHSLAAGGNWLAIALRPWPFSTNRDGLLATLAQGLDRALVAADALALFVPMQPSGGEGDADLPFARAVRERMRERERTSVLETETSPGEVSALLGASRAVVAMRLHALLLAANAGVPGLPIAYDPKVRAIAAELGIEELVLPVDPLSPEQLAGGIARLLSERALFAQRSRACGQILRERANAGIRAVVQALGAAPRLPALSRLLGAGAIAAARDLASARRENLARREEQERELGRSIAERDRLLAEVDQLRRESGQIVGRLTDAEGKLARSLEELAQARSEAKLTRAAAERHRLELVRIQTSRLWKFGNLYWSARRRLGLSTSPSPTASSIAPARASAAPLAPSRLVAPPADAPRPPLPGGLPPRHDVLCLPIIDWDFRFQRPQQLMGRFAAAGHRVFYVSQRFRQTGPSVELREVRERVFEVSLRAPSLNVYRDDPAPALDALFAGLDLLRRDAALGATAMVVQLPFWWPLADRARTHFAWPVVYDCLDLHSGFSTNESPMLALESDLLAGADLVLASAAALEVQARKLNSRVLRLPNACEFEHFSGIPIRTPAARPVVGYYGAISDWFDSRLVGELAARNPDWRFVLVGSTFGADLGPLEGRPNVELIGEVSYAELPRWLEQFDVCVIPFRRTPLTEATDPVKVYEMLAGGKPVVSTPLPEIVALGSLVRVAEDVAGFEEEIRTALSSGDDGEAGRRRAFAAEQTWQHRFEQMAPAVKAAFPRLSVVVVTHNNADLTARCLESLDTACEWPNLEVVVADNDSSDESRGLLTRWASGRSLTTLQLNAENLGFAAANNRALAVTSGEFLLLLNNDTVVTRGAFAMLVRHLHANPGIGLLGPATNAISNAAQVATSYRDLDELPAWAADWSWRNDGRLERLDMAAMFCLAMRREVCEQLGPLDERFAVGMFEDDDYSLRARRIGLEVCCAYDAFIHHWQKSAFRLLGESTYRRIFEENRQRFVDKWGSSAPSHRIPEAAQRSLPPHDLLRRAAEAPGTVVFLPSVGWGIHLLQRPHHLARVLAQRGYLVVFDCSNAYDAVEGFAELEPNLFLFRGDPETLHALPAPLLWSFPYNFHLCADYPEGAVSLYDWIDDLAVFPYEPAMLERNHRQALAKAPIVASVAQRLHREALAERADALYLPNAVDLAHFAAPPPPPDDPAFAAMLASGRHIAGYYGALADWFDYELIAAVAAERPDWGFVLIGPDYEGALARNRSTLRAENILCLGPRDYALLPAYLARFDVATIPFRINDITLATSPLKLYEYFAGGKPVVTSAMPECQAFSEVLIAEGPDAFSRALDEALARASDPAFRARLRELARENDWSARIDAVLPLWEARRHLPRQRSPWSTRAHRQPVAGDTLPLAGSPESRRQDDHPLPATTSPPPAASNPDSAVVALAARFAHLRPESDRRYFDALLAHLAGIADHPFLPVYVEYAATAVQRGRLAVASLRPHIRLDGARVLDIGCAYGGFLVALAEAGAVPLGIDVNDRLLALSRHLAADHEVPIEALLHDASVARPEFAAAFDLIVANDVIEHVAALDPFLANISRWLAPQGTAYLEIPNGRFPGFVRKDGHHGAFAVSLLEFSTAAELLRTTGLASSYDTFNYLTLAEYRSCFAENGLQVELLPGSLDGFSREAVLAEIESLRREWPGRVEEEIPPAFRDVTSRALRAYLAELDASGVCEPGREQDLYERYGASFWRVLCRRS